MKTLLPDGYYVGVLGPGQLGSDQGMRLFRVFSGKASDVCWCSTAYASPYREDHLFVQLIMSHEEEKKLYEPKAS